MIRGFHNGNTVLMAPFASILSTNSWTFSECLRTRKEPCYFYFFEFLLEFIWAKLTTYAGKQDLKCSRTYFSKKLFVLHITLAHLVTTSRRLNAGSLKISSCIFRNLDFVFIKKYVYSWKVWNFSWSFE